MELQYEKIREEKFRQLDELCMKNPDKIPAKDVAKFLKCNLEGLQAGLEKGTVPFGFAYRQDKTVGSGRKAATVDGRRETFVSTVKFFDWMTKVCNMEVTEA